MMKRIHIFLLLLLTGCLIGAGCGRMRSSEAVKVEIDSLMRISDSLIAKHKNNSAAFGVTFRILDLVREKGFTAEEQKAAFRIAVLYARSYNFEQAANYYSKAYWLGVANGDSARGKHLSLSGLIYSARMNGDTDTVFKYLEMLLPLAGEIPYSRQIYNTALNSYLEADSLEKALQIYQSMPPLGPEWPNPVDLNFDQIGAILMDRLGRRKEAVVLCERLFNQTDSFIRVHKLASYPTIQTSLYSLYASILMEKGEDEKALDYLERGSRISIKHPNVYLVAGLYLPKVKLLHTLDSVYTARGEWAKAHSNALLLVAMTDSLNKCEADREHMRMEKAYRNVELSLSLEQQQRRSEQLRSRLYIALGGIGFCLLLFILYAIYTRRLRRKNIRLARQIGELGTKAEELRNLRDALTRKSTTSLVTTGNSLFLRLEELMHAEKPYTNPNLTRRDLADRLGTNENYLFVALRDSPDGKTLTDYINTYRLDHARELLTASPELSIESIALDSGFASRQTFYRVFKKHFGMTPAEFRNYSQADN